MTPTAPLTRDLVLIGGGHAHALVLKRWGMNPLAGVRLTLIDPAPVAPYTGMLPGLIAGHYKREELEIDLVRLARFAGARLILGPAEGIDPEAQVVHVKDRGPIAYDVASINVGIHSAMPEIKGFAAHAYGAKPLGPFAEAWAQFHPSGGPSAVIGGGIAGVELALAMAHRTRAAVTLVEAGDAILRDNPASRARLEEALAQAGVTVLTGAKVEEVTPDSLRLANGQTVESAFTVGAAGARPHPWLAQTPLPQHNGFIRVGSDLRVEGQTTLFAAGDCAHLTHAPRPKAGVFAVRAAPVLHQNLRSVLMGTPTRPFEPQKRYLKLISLGQKSALAERGGRAFAGPLLWRLKDQIDRRFMAGLNDLPAMAAETPGPKALSEEPDTPLCGGCGSKVAPGVLTTAIETLPTRPDVLHGAGDDAAVLRMGDTEQVLTTDHLRAFTEDHGLMARITALHALGDIWAMGAAPQSAMVQITLPRMSEALQARTLEEIMSAAGEVFTEAGAAIIGGHSTMGAELTVGFSLTGLLSGPALTTAGAQAGDLLLLTRPIGSGVLLAAEMQRKARGADMAHLWRTLATSQQEAAAQLRDAHALTDVTGFGLAGHLSAICRASGLGAEIDLSAIPLYPGALALAEEGQRSTIWDANSRHAPVAEAEGPRGDLLYDPQTAGGFLAALPEDKAAEALAAIPSARIIGRMVAGAGLTASPLPQAQSSAVPSLNA